ncbi:MAG: DUF4168 domain-containing protein [Gammaproteobacteria bacterium]|nr:DUF4168 domain-containing protein [Gammaproteobacteria bacterium]
MTYFNKLIAMFATLLLLLSSSLSAQQSMPQDAAPPAEVPVEKLEKFVDAQKSILDIQKKYSNKMENTDDQKQSEQLRQQANQEMVVAVEEAGLDVDSYNQIAMAVRADPELQKQLEDMN